MPAIYRYHSDYNGCDICRDWNGEEGSENWLPQAPNPNCRNAFSCNCWLEFVSDDDPGCNCMLNCPGEYWDDECDCPAGCCCVADDWSRYWDVHCQCGGGGGGQNDCVPFCEDGEGNCNPPYYWCEDLDGEVWCIPDDVCYDIGGN